MRIANLGIRGWGQYVPMKKEVPTLADHISVSVANKEETTYYMAESAVRAALRTASLSPVDLENQYFICCNEAPTDYLYQLLGRMVLDRMEVDETHSFNMTQSGNSALFATYLLACHLTAGMDGSERGVICAPSHWEFHSDNRKLGASVLSDMATAIIVEKGYRRNRILSISAMTDPSLHDVAYTRLGGSLKPLDAEACRNGEFVYKIQSIASYQRSVAVAPVRARVVCEKALREAGADWTDIATFVVASASEDIERRFVHITRVDEEIIVRQTLPGTWSCSASVLSALTNALSVKGEVGDLLLVTSIGIDGNYAASVIQR